MKEWKQPKLEDLDVTLTQSGGRNRSNADLLWTTYDEFGDPEDHIKYGS